MSEDIVTIKTKKSTLTFFQAIPVKGDKGDDGKSAYQLWLDAGNTGTETDFLISLQGAGADLSDYFTKEEISNLISSTNPHSHANKAILDAILNTPASDNSVVHKSGDETVAGNKTFSGNTTLGDETNNFKIQPKVFALLIDGVNEIDLTLPVITPSVNSILGIPVGIIDGQLAFLNYTDSQYTPISVGIYDPNTKMLQASNISVDKNTGRLLFDNGLALYDGNNYGDFEGRNITLHGTISGDGSSLNNMSASQVGAYTIPQTDNLLNFKANSSDLNSYVPTARTVNSKVLNADVVLTTSDISDNPNQRYCTDSQKTAYDNAAANSHSALTLGTNTNGLSLSDQNLSLAQASATVTGALSYADWNTFNNKQNALGYNAANDSLVGHLAGTETFTGQKTFTRDLLCLGPAQYIGSSSVPWTNGYISNLYSNIVYASSVHTSTAIIGSTTAMLKRNSGIIQDAVDGTDYLSPAGDGSNLTGIHDAGVIKWVSTTSSLTTADFGKFIEITGSSALTITIPTAVGNNGKIFKIWNNSTVTQTISSAGGNFYGAGGTGSNTTTFSLSAGQYIEIVADGNWILNQFPALISALSLPYYAGSNTSRSANTVYQAATDLFVIATVTSSTAAGTASLARGTTSSPSYIIASFTPAVNAATITLTGFVASGEYFKLTTTNMTVNVMVTLPIKGANG